MTLFKPMLAAVADLDKITYPILASHKLDGIRCIVRDGKPMSRSMKEIPNRFVQQMFAALPRECEGFDGELIVGDPTAKDCYQKTVSGVMSEDGEPDFRFYVFDIVAKGSVTFEARLFNAYLKHNTCKADWIVLHAHWQIDNRQELDIIEHRALIEGYEGLILRDPNGLYKQGRSTIKQGGMLKVKRFQDAEAVIIGFEELQHNDNEAFKDELGHTKRSSHQENKVAMNTLGALVVSPSKDQPFYGVSFKLGTGFDQALRKKIWDDRDQYVGKLVKYKYFDVGVKDAPRHPVFLGFRDPIDI